MAEPAILLFDGECPLCRHLAAIVAARSRGTLRAEAWQESAHGKGFEAPADIALVSATTRWDGAAAWEEILTRHPDLRAWHWLAAQCGLVGSAARVLRQTAKLAKFFCVRCGKRV